MIISEIMVEIKFPWWKDIYVGFYLFINNRLGIKVDADRVAARLLKHTKYTHSFKPV